MSNSSFDSRESIVNDKFIIIYDKFTKPMAISLRNSINQKYTCAIWDDKIYKNNESRLTNHNYLIILSQECIKQHFRNPQMKLLTYLDGIDILLEGNTLGFKYNSKTSPKKINDILKEKWKQYLLATIGPIIIAGGIPTALVLSIYLMFSQKKKIRFKLFFDAINKFRDEDLEKFLNGKLG